MSVHDERATERSLRAERLSLAYGGADVVADLDLDVPTGKVTVIVGANACGKSTLLRALARLMKPRAGTVLLDGQAITRLRLGRSPAGLASSRSRRSPPRASPWPTWWHGAATRTNASSSSGRPPTRQW